MTLALSGSYQTVVTIYGNTSYIDWDDWHHYCLTYDGTDIVLYFDGLAEATAPASLDTETMYGLRVGADIRIPAAGRCPARVGLLARMHTSTTCKSLHDNV